MFIVDDHKEANARIAHRIRMVRQRCNLTEHDLAVKASRIENYESGEASITAVELVRLSQALNMPVEYFVQPTPFLDWSAEWQLVHSYRRLPRNQQDELMRLLVALANGESVYGR